MEHTATWTTAQNLSYFSPLLLHCCVKTLLWVTALLCDTFHVSMWFILSQSHIYRLVVINTAAKIGAKQKRLYRRGCFSHAGDVAAQTMDCDDIWTCPLWFMNKYLHVKNRTCKSADRCSCHRINVFHNRVLFISITAAIQTTNIPGALYRTQLVKKLQWGFIAPLSQKHAFQRGSSKELQPLSWLFYQWCMKSWIHAWIPGKKLVKWVLNVKMYF